MKAKRLTEKEKMDVVRDFARVMDEQDIPKTNRYVRFKDGTEYRPDEQGNWMRVEDPVSLGTPEDPVVVTPENVAQVTDAIARAVPLPDPEPAQPME